ncbi:hypothetical protein D1Y78_00245 [Riemerella anatipestifer]|nr:hypothetical protein [Riemerella anatipestifer]
MFFKFIFLDIFIVLKDNSFLVKIKIIKNIPLIKLYRPILSKKILVTLHEFIMGYAKIGFTFY